MSDERGGRYFREARFFLAGDKVAAQSHILEARSLLGYLRDQHSMGGPPIQVKYAGLKDGTLIKATMMNGQFQAEIVSPKTVSEKKKGIIPTFFGVSYRSGQFITYTDAFKWQEKTGITILAAPAGSTSTRPYSISEDGEFVYGVYYLPDPTFIQIQAGAVVWGVDGGIVELLPLPTGWGYAGVPSVVDYTFLDPTPIPVAYLAISNDLYRHRFLEDGSHMFVGSMSVGGQVVGTATTRALSTPAVSAPPDVIVLQDLALPPPSYVYAASGDGNTLVGEYGAGNAAAVWRRPNAHSAYVRTDIAGARSAYDVTDDGLQIGCQIDRVRAIVTDTVPAIWTAATGLMQLEQFDPSPNPSLYSVSTVAYVHSKGGVAGGEYALSPYSRVVFWTYDDSGMRQRYQTVSGNILGGN